MATLLTVGNSEGERRCDAKCYDAKAPGCECCCGGANHGKGRAAAQANVEALARQSLARMAADGSMVARDIAAQLGMAL